jgi:hypothetical protein
MLSEFMKKDTFLKTPTDSPKKTDMETFLRSLELSYFSYGLILEGEVLFSYFTHQEWGQLYQEKHYNKIDPLLRGVVQSHFPLIVWDALHPSGEEKKVMMERNEVCRLNSGLTIGITKENSTEIIAFGSEVSPQNLHARLMDMDYARKIYDMTSHFYQMHISRILKGPASKLPSV